MYKLNYKNKVFIILLCLVSCFISSFSPVSAAYVNNLFSGYVDPVDGDVLSTDYNTELKPLNVNINRHDVTGNTIDSITWENPKGIDDTYNVEVYTVLTFCYKDIRNMQMPPYNQWNSATYNQIQALPWSYVDIPVMLVKGVNNSDELIKATDKTVDIDFDREVLNEFYSNFDVIVKDNSTWLSEVIPALNSLSYGLSLGQNVSEGDLGGSYSAFMDLFNYLHNLAVNPYEENPEALQNYYVINFMNKALEYNVDTLFTYKSNYYYIRYEKNNSNILGVDDLGDGDFLITTYTHKTINRFVDGSQPTLGNVPACVDFLVQYSFILHVDKPIYFYLENFDGEYYYNIANTSNVLENEGNMLYFYYDQRFLNFRFLKENTTPVLNTNFTISDFQVLNVFSYYDLQNQCYQNYGFSYPTLYYKCGMPLEINHIPNNDSITYDSNFGFYFDKEIQINLKYQKYERDLSGNYKPEMQDNSYTLANERSNYLGYPIGFDDKYTTRNTIKDFYYKDLNYINWFNTYTCSNFKELGIGLIKSSEIPFMYSDYYGNKPQVTYNSITLNYYFNDMQDFKKGSSIITTSGYTFSQFVQLSNSFPFNSFTEDNSNRHALRDPETGRVEIARNYQVENAINYYNQKYIHNLPETDDNTELIKRIIQYLNSIDSRLQNTLTIMLRWNVKYYFDKFDDKLSQIINLLNNSSNNVFNFNTKFNLLLGLFTDGFLSDNTGLNDSLLRNNANRFPVCLLFLPETISNLLIAEPVAPPLDFKIDIPYRGVIKNNHSSLLKTQAVSFGATTKIGDSDKSLVDLTGGRLLFDNFFVLLRSAETLIFAYGLFKLTFIYLKNADD